MYRVTTYMLPVEMGEDTYVPKLHTHRVPPLVHHMAPTEHDLPIEWQHSYDSCRGVHQRFEGSDKYTFKLWRDESMRKFVLQEYPWFIKTYDAYPQNIQRVDAARYFILRKYGGIYVDMDVGCKRSLDNLRRLPEAGIIMPETSPLGVSNDFIIAAPEHPFMIFVTQRLQAWSAERYSSFLTVMLSTGPAFLSIAAYDFFSQAPAHAQDIGKMAYADYTHNVLFHLPGSSWLKADGRFVMYFFNNIFFYCCLVGTCGYCCYFNRHGGFDRLSKRANMKNVNTASDMVEVLTDAGIGSAKDFAADHVLPILMKTFPYSAGAGVGARDSVEQGQSLLNSSGTRIRPSRKQGKWRHGERDKDAFGDYLPEESSLLDDDGADADPDDDDDLKDGGNGYSDTDDDEEASSGFKKSHV